jgi:hypothetical protein
MRPARITVAALFAAAVAVTGCAAQPTADHPSAAPQAPAATAPRPGNGPTAQPPTTNPSGGQPATGRCASAALQGAVQGTEGAAGTIWTTVDLRNTSARTCTVKGIPEVRLLGDEGQPLTAPSKPDGSGGHLLALRPGEAARFAFGIPNVCDSTVTGSRIRVTLPPGQASLVVALGRETAFGTCANVHVQPLERASA